MCSARRFTRYVNHKPHGRINRARRPAIAVVTTSLLCIGACDALRQSRSGTTADGALSPVLVRLRDAYSDLASGRFVVLADFETAEQEKLLRVESSDESSLELEQPAIDITIARNETGAGSVRSVLPDGRAALIFDGARSERLSLIRDWGTYQLLLLNTRASANATLELTINAGRDSDQRWATRLRVGSTWQLHRVDLADVAEAVDIHDIRSISLRSVEMAGPLTLHLDDFVLADNTREMLSGGTSAGDVSVRSAGRRTHVTVRDRFDLGFCDGQICSWTSESSANLVACSGLGPWPVALRAGWYADHDAPPAYDDPRMFAGFGEVAVAAQRVVEATSYRVQIDGQWRFVSTASTDEREPAEIGWRYTVYADGRVFVLLRCNPGAAPWPQEYLGQAVAVRGDRQFERVPAAVSADRAAPVFTLLARNGAQRADLLWIPSSPADAAHSMFLSTSDQRRDGIIWGERSAAGTVEFASQLVVWPRDIEAGIDAVPLARNYQQPPKVSVLTGNLLRDCAGDLNNDGYNEGEGTYELAATDGIVRFRLACPAAVPDRFRFRVRNTAGAKAWVYVSGRILRETGRDAEDNLLFTLPVTSAATQDVEINTRPERTVPEITRPTASTQPVVPPAAR